MEEHFQPLRIRTNIKFQIDKDGSPIAFVYKNGMGSWRGCRENENCGKKKIVVADKEICASIIPEVLYMATLIPMHNEKGFVAISVKPKRFIAAVKIVPEVHSYKIQVKFGNKVIEYDPYNKRDLNRSQIDGVCSILSKRPDILNKEQAIATLMEFARTAMRIYKFPKTNERPSDWNSGGCRTLTEEQENGVSGH